MHARKGQNGPKCPKSQFLTIFTLHACTDACTEPQVYSHEYKGIDVYFSTMFDFFTVSTLKVLKTSMHVTLFSGLVCTACAHYSIHTSRSCWVSLESSDQDLLENGKFGELLMHR